jgi:hypothetical protein
MFAWLAFSTGGVDFNDSAILRPMGALYADCILRRPTHPESDHVLSPAFILIDWVVLGTLVGHPSGTVVD